jgi:hypothetical protein
MKWLIMNSKYLIQKRNFAVLGFFIILVLSEVVWAQTPFEGYNLFSPLRGRTTYLMDNDGNTLHTWNHDKLIAESVYLLENGELLYTAEAENTVFYDRSGKPTDGHGGIVQFVEWDGTVKCEYEYVSDTYMQHHDVAITPAGTVLMVTWQVKSADEAIAMGRDPSKLIMDYLWYLGIVEVDVCAGEIIWEWHAWDHLVQNYDANFTETYGELADFPELIDVNAIFLPMSDWLHTNAIDYNADLDQVMVSIHALSEIWIIDHSTTTEEAASHSGGNSGKGGDLLYRWGNPQIYGAGETDDQKLYHQHDAEWIDKGLEGEGNILIFNNGMDRPDGDYSQVVELETPVDADGNYTLTPGSAYAPENYKLIYQANPATDFFAEFISGAQRLPNGNTLIVDGPDGYMFEITSSGEKVWEYDHGQATFRVERYAPDYPGFIGTELEPTDVNQNGFDSEIMPENFVLNQNYPNPFNPNTIISFILPIANRVNLKIYDLCGKQVAELVDGRLNAGTHLIEWQAKSLPSGIYHYTLKAGSFSETKKMVLIR